MTPQDPGSVAFGIMFPCYWSIVNVDGRGFYGRWGRRLCLSVWRS